MKRWQKVLVGITFSFLFCFLCIGFAEVTDTLNIQGTIEIEPPQGVIITNVSSPAGGTVNRYFGGMLNTKTDLSAGSSGTVTYTVSLYNNSPYSQYFKGIVYEAEAYDNSNITFTLNGLALEQEVTTKQRLDVTLTFSYVNASAISNTVLNSIINFTFGMTPADTAVEGALGRFAQILNDEQMFAELDAEMERSWFTSDLIGNVANRNIFGEEADAAFVEELFTGENGINYLTLQVDEDTEVNVTVMITGTDLNGDGQYDRMALYLTPNEISGRTSNVNPVYAAVFIKENNSWIETGELFKGKATGCRYSSGINMSGLGWNNSFNPSTWRSTQAYYNIAGGATIDTIIAAIPNE